LSGELVVILPSSFVCRPGRAQNSATDVQVSRRVGQLYDQHLLAPTGATTLRRQLPEEAARTRSEGLVFWWF